METDMAKRGMGAATQGGGCAGSGSKNKTESKPSSKVKVMMAGGGSVGLARAAQMSGRTMPAGSGRAMPAASGRAMPAGSGRAMPAASGRVSTFAKGGKAKKPRKGG